MSNDDRILKSLGFYRHLNVYTGKTVWAWGRYTVESDLGTQHQDPIVEWDEEAGQAYSSPIHYHKKITSIKGLEKFVEATNFLMSTEG